MGRPGFYKRSMNSWLRDNGIEKHWTPNKGSFFVAERYIKTLKKKIYKQKIALLTHICINRADEIVDK